MGSKIYGKNQIKYTIKTIRKENIDSKISINDKFFTKIKLKQGEWAYWAGMVDGDGAVKENCDFILRLTDKNIIINLAKMITNPESKGTCIAIQGPMGNGKTTLVKEGICKALNRPFGFLFSSDIL